MNDEPEEPTSHTVVPGSTRDALMDAALDQLSERGVLAGLNLSEVAEAVGVTPANIYYYFGSRQGLLRAALARESAHMLGPLVSDHDDSYVGRRLRVYDEIVRLGRLRMTALLALDGDPDFEPFPFLEVSRARYQEMFDSGHLPEDFDLDAANALGVAMTIGISIYAEPASRQLGMTQEEFVERVRAVYGEMLDAMVERRRDGAGESG